MLEFWFVTSHLSSLLVRISVTRWNVSVSTEKFPSMSDCKNIPSAVREANAFCIMEPNQGPLKSLDYTTGPWCSSGFRSALTWAPMMPKTPFSRTVAHLNIVFFPVCQVECRNIMIILLVILTSVQHQFSSFVEVWFVGSYWGLAMPSFIVTCFM